MPFHLLSLSIAMGIVSVFVVTSRHVYMLADKILMLVLQ